MAANTYPLLDVFWTMLLFFAFVVWIWLLVVIFGDIFRSGDLGGGAKALWVLFVLVVPFAGILVYLVARGEGMSDRRLAAAQGGPVAFAT